MKIFVTLSLLLSGAAYLGFVPAPPVGGNFPFPLIAGGIITAGMLYFLARAEN